MTAPQEHVPEGAPEWMVSYADMITIMMAFFVVMYAMSGAKDTDKGEPLLNSLHKQFGRHAVDAPGTKVSKASLLAGMGDGHAARTDGDEPGGKKTQPTGDDNRVTMIRPGDQRTIGGVISFEGIETGLSTAQKQKLKSIAAEFDGKQQKIEIRGHASCQPLPEGSAHRDHWDLAYARCHTTLRSLVDCGLDTKRIRVSVAAQNEPASLGAEEEQLRRNGRVEIFMLNEFTETFRGTPQQRAEQPITTPDAS